MAQTVTINLRAIRKQIGAEIANLQKAIEIGTGVVIKDNAASQSYSDGVGDKQALDTTRQKNEETLSKARTLLEKLQQQEVLFAQECCDEAVQNCQLRYL